MGQLDPKLKKLFDDFQKSKEQDSERLRDQFLRITNESQKLGRFVAQNTESVLELSSKISSHLTAQQEHHEEVRKDLDEIKKNQGSPLFFLLGTIISAGAFSAGFYLGFRHSLPSSMTEEEAVQVGTELFQILGYTIMVFVRKKKD